MTAPLRLALACLLAVSLAGCASLSREDFTAAEAYRARPEAAADIRFNADDQAAALAFTNGTRRQLAANGGASTSWRSQAAARTAPTARAC